MFELKHKFEFSASHTLPTHHICSQLHGHTWTCILRIRGKGLQDGMLVDLHTIEDTAWNLSVVKLDHKHLNDSTELEHPTCEELAKWIFFRMDMRIRRITENSCWLHSVEVAENSNNSATYWEKP